MGGMCFGGDRGGVMKIQTLNYCGISYSPFEFYLKEHEDDLQKISRIFTQLIVNYVPDFDSKFKWKMGKIEKNFKLGRYSNMFNLNTGIENKKFINKMEFQELWYHFYQMNLQETNKKPQLNEYQEQVCLYDFIMYHTLLKFVYGDQPFEELIKNNPSKFQKTLKPFYQISFLNEELKLQKFKAGMQTHMPDVLFIQEYSSVLLYYLKKIDFYDITIDKEKDSLVALNKKYFIMDPNRDRITHDLRKQHKWFETSAITVANQIIFCSVHLTSNEVKRKMQVIELREALIVLIEDFKDYNFVLAGYIGSFIKFEIPGIYFYPQNEEAFTTIKKRTASQAQFHKAEKEVKESKDKIISSLPLDKCKVSFIDGYPANYKSYLPTDSHPHDHFLVEAQIFLRKQ